ncbi:MAG: hypothetical protein ACT4PE_02685 [Candidatus Eiseniibacteriota bacterium]
MFRRRIGERLLAALMLAFCGASVSFALPPGVPDPPMTFVGLSAPAVACQYRFNSVGTLDALTVTVAVDDEFGVPVGFTPITVELVPNAATLAFCTCDVNPALFFTDAFGGGVAAFDQVAGRGGLDVVVTAVGFFPPIVLAVIPITFTSPDLSGSCALAPAPSVTIADLGIWAAGLPPGYLIGSDYNCDGVVSVVDLGFWAANGLAVPGC